MLKKIAAAGVVLVAAVLAFAATRPDAFRVERTATIQAPPEAVYALIHDFRRWNEWSPFEKLDPRMERTFGGAAAGRGATYAWSGNGQAGAGRMEIVGASPERVTVRMDFRKPMRITNTAEFILEPAAGGTRVTWAMHGPSPFLSKVIGVFVDMDRMLGREFEAGLASLGAEAERQAAGRVAAR